MRSRGIVGVNLLSALEQHFFTGLCTIYEGTPTQSATGAITETFAALSGHEDIPCRVAPVKSMGEMDLPAGTILDTTHDIALAGYYSGIDTTQQAVVAGTTYDIRRVDHDGQQAMTWLRVRLVE